LRLLAAAIERNYCAYSNLQLDPMLWKVRNMPGFEKLLTSAKECQKSVYAQSGQTPR
jgi:hypothetical protein